MKYIYIITLLSLSIALASCFSKPVTQEVDPIVAPEEQEDKDVSLEEIEENDQSATGTTMSGSEDAIEEKPKENQDEVNEEGDTGTGDEQEIIEEYEEDLEELFNDILGS